jgi:hypothetical protein
MPLGGLGVYTKAAQKVYHWPGPPQFPIEGVSPHYHPEPAPPWFMVRYLSFPSVAKIRQAVQKIGENEIGFILMGFTPGMMASNIATNNTEDQAYLKQFTASVQGPGFMIILAGNSANDFEYKKEVLQQIMLDFEGQPLEAVEDPRNAAGFIWRFIRVSGSIREVDRATGVFGGQVGCTDVFPLMHQYILESASFKQDLIDAGRVLDDGAGPFIQPSEHGHYGHGELLIRYNPNKPESVMVQGEVMQYANQKAISGHFGVPGHVFGEAHDAFGPRASNYHRWLKQIKKTFDPNAVSESTYYIRSD